jgi:hypothetical protein
MRPRSAYEDRHEHIDDVPSYAVMIKFISHYETHVDMFCHYGRPLTVLKGSPLIVFFSLLFYVIGVFIIYNIN